MKYICLILFWFKIAFAVCTLSIPNSVDLGNYTIASGAQGNVPITLTNCNNNSEQIYYYSQINTVLNTNTVPIGLYSSDLSVKYTNVNNTILNTSISSSLTFNLIIKADSGYNYPAGTYTGNVVLKIIDGNSQVQYWTINVSFSIPSVCSLNTSGINFGTINNSSLTLSTGYVYATCTKNTSLTLSASAGNSGNINSRKLKKNGGTETLIYNVHTDPSLNNVWGDGTSGNIPFTDVGTGVQQSFNIYGAIGINQYPSPGAYTDSLTVTMTY